MGLIPGSLVMYIATLESGRYFPINNRRKDAFTCDFKLESASQKAGLEGLYSLIFQDPGDEWTYLNALKTEVEPYL